MTLRRRCSPRPVRVLATASAALVAAAAAAAWSPAHAGAIAPLIADLGAPDLVWRPAEWQSRAPQTLEDVLRRVPGIAIARNGGTGSAEMMSVLGSPTGRIEWLLDGVAVASPELHWTRLHAIPLGMVDRIEIYRRTEPARIAIWTRDAAANAAAVDFDLGRGSLDSRTRRVHLLTPPRPVTVTVGYDEVLRGDEDFRSAAGAQLPPLFGSFDSRTQLVRVDLQRAGRRVRLTHVADNSNTHGSIQGALDVWRTDAARTDLRWDDAAGERLRWALVVGHQSWDHQRRIAGLAGPLREGRTHAALDIGRSGTWSTWLRFRSSDVNADGRAAGDDGVALRYAAHAAEVEVAHDAKFDVGAHLGWLDDERATWDFTAGAHAGIDAGAWRLGVEIGRGVTVAGYGAAGDELRRRGEWTAVSARRAWRDLEWSTQAFAKSLRDRHRASGAFFPGSEAGPERLAGVLSEARWARAGRRWRGGAVCGVVWTPDVEGDRAGLGATQARVRADLGSSWRADDLTFDGFVDWALDARRRWGTTAELAPAARADVGIDIGFLERLHFFCTLSNVTDVATETFPGVRLPARDTFVGVRARLID